MRHAGGYLLLLLALSRVAACQTGDVGRVDSTALTRTANGPALRVVILGAGDDARVPAAREAIAHWNTEFRRLGRRVQFDSGTVRTDSVPDDVLRAAMNEVALGDGPATARLRARLDNVPADVVIALSNTDLISFSVRWRAGSRGVVGVRRADIPPLSAPNTVRNVIAHELGHVLGLSHNADSTTLMCGRPSPCRPATFASPRVIFFPLTADDERAIVRRWP